MSRAAPDFTDSEVDFTREASGDFRSPRLSDPWRARGGSRLLALRAGLAHTFAREMDARRGFLWLPVAFGAGIVAYFALPQEPSAWALIGLALAFVAAAWRARFHPAALRALVVLLAIAAGGMAAKLRTDIVAAPMLDREVTANVVGWISGLEETADGGRRAYIRVDHLDSYLNVRPRTVRITIRSQANRLAVGDAIAVLARLAPPSGPVQPGAYDFAQSAFYEGIGAYGFAFGAPKPAVLSAPPLDILLSEPIAAVRETIRRRVEAALAGDDGHVASALIMGDQNGISDQTQNDMRASGLGHVLSISGLHMAIVAGAVLWLLRALLALSPSLALRRPIKKWAAGVALAVSAIYLAISGGGVATERSFIMLAIMLGAIMVGRRALTLRNVALAALVVMVLQPEAVLTASFQMSFAATAALVAAFEVIAARAAPSLGERRHPLIARARRDLSGMVLTSLIAGLATAPFAIYQFQRLAPLTLLANLAAMPAISLIVMPMAFLTAIAMPFGLEAWPLHAMGFGLDWMDWVAAKTAAWSVGYGSVAQPAMLSFLVAIAGMLWLILWGERWRLLGLVAIVAAVPLAAATPRPDLLVNADGSAAAVRGADGRLRVLGSDLFSVENWLRADGDQRLTGDPSLADGVHCDRYACLAALPNGETVSLVLKPEAFAEDCRHAAVVLSNWDAPAFCKGSAQVVDRPMLGAGGAEAFYREGAGYRVAAAYPAERRPFMQPRQH